MLLCPRHATHRHGHIVLTTELQEPPLIILQSIARALDLHHAIPRLVRPELHQVRKSRPILDHITQDPFKPKPQMRRWKAMQRGTEQRVVQEAPVYERRLRACFSNEPLPNDVFVTVRIQFRKAFRESVASTFVEVGAFEVCRAMLEVVEECSRYRRKDRVPTQEPK